MTHPSNMPVSRLELEINIPAELLMERHKNEESGYYSRVSLSRFFWESYGRYVGDGTQAKIKINITRRWGK